jgi:hypothetical protein
VDISFQWRGVETPIRGGRYHLASAFTARFESENQHTVELDIAIEGDEPVCNAIRVIRRPGRPALSSAELRRVPVAHWMALACTEAARRVEGEVIDVMMPTDPDGQIKVEKVGERFGPLEGAQRDAALEEFGQPRRKTRITEGRLRDVARTCAEFEREGVPLWRVVRDIYFVSRSQAFELIRRAKAAGYYVPQEAS